jgi:hypothetical protein
MSYHLQLQNAAKWLAENRNPDHGWGLAAGQASSIVNTSEAIFVLDKAGKGEYRALIAEGLTFIETKTLTSVIANPKTRYVYFALSICLDNLDKVNHIFINNCANWLLAARNNDGAWGHSANDEQSALYPTVMSTIVLVKLGHSKELESTCNWIVSKNVNNSWSFNIVNQPSLVATAQAMIALNLLKSDNSELINKSKELLLSVSMWGGEAEDMPGTSWIHCSQMWVFWALMQLGVDPYAKPIAQGVRELNKLNCDHGWREPSKHLTVRGLYWAVSAFNCLHQAYDPALHTYRIDSALSVSEMQEPSFVRILPHTKWSFVLPKTVYQGATYVLLFISAAAFLGIHRLTQQVPRKAELMFSVSCFVITYLLVQKRKALFPVWVLNAVISVVVILSFIDLVFGYAVTHIFDFITSLIEVIQKK